ILLDPCVRRPGAGHTFESSCGLAQAGIERSGPDATRYDGGVRHARCGRGTGLSDGRIEAFPRRATGVGGAEGGRRTGRDRCGDCDLCSRLGPEERKVMPDFRNSRRNLKIAIGAMLAADVVAVAVLFSPLVGSPDSRRLQILELKAELTRKTREVEPLRGMDKKIVLAKDQIGGFYHERFAAKDSVLVNELGKLANENGVRMQQVSYKEEEAESSGIIPMEIAANFSGDYLQLVRFINALERSKMFFEVDSVGLAGEGTGPVRLEIVMHSYLRSGA